MTASMADGNIAPGAGIGMAAQHWHRRPRTTRRGVQLTLGVLWLVDAALQLQPFMFTPDFARQVLAPAGQGQPAWVAVPTDYFAGLIAGHPASLNSGFALVQLALGVGFLIPRLVRPAIVGSLAWAFGIWWFGEGLGGLATGDASLVTGAPGAVVLYVVLALAAWPATDRRDPPDSAKAAVARWFPAAWAVLWIGGALLQLLPSQRGTAALHDQLGNTDGVPGWLASLHHLSANVLRHGGEAPFIALVALMTLVGLAGLAGRPWRTAAAVVGAVAATAFWVLGQNVGELYSGQSTDPNTGPLIVLMALALGGVGAHAKARAGAQARAVPAATPRTAVSP